MVLLLLLLVRWLLFIVDCGFFASVESIDNDDEDDEDENEDDDSTTKKRTAIDADIIPITMMGHDDLNDDDSDALEKQNDNTCRRRSRERS